ncbi:SETMAR [Cordylochernes scorpioides]|uniref:SETMAR n=1 Tax=Cordylochernes scorpioides TaxID=51811 RepID=A0ABY6K9U8_9ARAC|nr:SETMAR [Cordylochernes scorpioides]
MEDAAVENARGSLRDHSLSKSQCYRWFKKFQSGDFELDNGPHGKPPQKFEDAELQALLDEDSTQMQEKLAKQLQVSQGAVSLRLNSLGKTQKLSRWVPHEHEKKSFLHRIVTSDKKWIHFSNPTRLKSWCLLGQYPKQTPRPNRFGKKAKLCIWWDQTGIVYFELLKPGKMVNTSRYEQQMHSLREALNEKKTGMA